LKNLPRNVAKRIKIVIAASALPYTKCSFQFKEENWLGVKENMRIANINRGTLNEKIHKLY
jgi:hypothetical protein